MPRPGPGVPSSGLKADKERVSSSLKKTRDSSDSSIPRAKRQRVEVVLHASSRRTLTSSANRIPHSPTSMSVQARATPASSASTRVATPLPTSTSQPLKPKAPTAETAASSSHSHRHSAAVKAHSTLTGFDMNKWKEGLRGLYSLDCTLLDDNKAQSALEAHFAKLPNPQARKTANEYAGVLVDVVRGSVKGDHDNALRHKHNLSAELESAQADLAEAQRRVDIAQSDIWQAEHEYDEKKNRLDRVGSVSEVLLDVSAAFSSATQSTEDGVIVVKDDDDSVDELEDSDDSDLAPETPAHVKDGANLPYTTMFVVNGYINDVSKEYNAIWLGGRTLPVTKKDFKIWPVHLVGGSEDTRHCFVTTSDAMEIAPEHMCKRCKEGPREMRGFPTDPTSAKLVQPRCLIRTKTSAERMLCMACRRSSEKYPDRCGLDERAVRNHLVDLGLGPGK